MSRRPTIIHTRTPSIVSRVLKGSRATHDAPLLDDLYRQIYGLTLVHYDHPRAIACPAGSGVATYHLLFTRQGRALLGVREQDAGCRFLSIDGHRHLGSHLGVLVLLPQVPLP